VKYSRVLLKISGEALAGEDKFGINPSVVQHVVKQLKIIHQKGIQIAIVIGGGNFWRGRQGQNMDRTTADHMGMLATIINALALQDACEKADIPTRVQTAISVPAVAEPYILRKAIRHFEKGRIVIFACGTGNPYFTTDTGAALRAAEIDAEIIMLAKNIDGIYDDDPATNPNAKRYDMLSYAEILRKNLHAMDSTATSLSMDNSIPVLFFALNDPENIYRALMGEKVGTIVI